MKAVQRIKYRTTIWSSHLTFGYLSKELKSVSSDDTSTPTFFEEMFIIAKKWNSAFIDRWMHRENMVYTYNGILFSLKKGGNSALYDKMDKPCRHFTYVNWASQRKINTACFILVLLHEVSKIIKFTELCKSGMMVARAGWRRKWGVPNQQAYSFI